MFHIIKTLDQELLFTGEEKMKILKVLEKIFLYVASFLSVASLVLSAIIDESQNVNGMMTYFSSSFSFVGLGGVFTIGFALIAGTLLYFNKNEIARKIAIGAVVTTITLIFFIALAIISESSKSAVSTTAASEPLSPLFALVGGILYVCSLLCGFIYYIVGLVKPYSEDQLDPVNDKKVVLIMKWRKLMDQKIITEEEFLAKRNELLEIK